MFLGHTVICLDPTDNLPDLVGAIPAEIYDEDAVVRKKAGVPVKGFFHPGSWNHVKGLSEKDQVMLLAGHIGHNIRA